MLRELLRCSDKKVLAKIAGDLDRKTVSVYEMTGIVPRFSAVQDAMINAISLKLETEVQLLDEHVLTALF